MQRLVLSYRFWAVPVLFSLLILGLSSCGGGSDSGNGQPTTLTLTPANTTSINYGEVTAVVVTVTDSGGNILTPGTVTWSSDKPLIAGVTATGGFCGDSTNSTTTTCVCAGQWTTNNVDCVAPTAPGTAVVTATVGKLTASITVFVHPRVARIDLSTTAPIDCISSAGTQQLTAQAFDANNNPISVGPDATAFFWSTSDASIATVNNSGLVTAVNPGKMNIFANISNLTSAPFSFATCAVKSISIHGTGVADTSFTLTTGNSQALTADVLDTKGQPITVTGAALQWSSTNNAAITVDQTGTVTTPGAGSAGIVATCSPALCNSGFTSVFSNVVSVTATGTSATQVLVASSGGTSLIPIDTTANTAGTAVTLPNTPNSLVYAPNGLTAYLGSATALMSYDPSTSAVTTVANVAGTVLALSNDGNRLILFDNPTNTLTVIDLSGTNATLVDRVIVTGVPNPCSTVSSDRCPRASFTPDSKTAYVVAGNNLYVSNAASSFKTIALGTAGLDVAVSAQGSFAFVAGGDTTISPYATCNNAKVTANVVAPTGNIQRMLSAVNGAKIYAIAPPSLNIISPSTNAIGCVPSLTDPLTSVDLGQGPFNAQQMLIASSGSKLYFLTGTGNIVVYDATANTGSAITLAAGATLFTGGLTLDGASLYVGGSDNAVHRIDTATATDAQQISVGFTPNFVAVRPK